MQTEIKVKGKEYNVPWTIADRVITYFRPSAGMERFRSRAMMALSGGGYKGASKTRKQTKLWQTNGNDADAVVQKDRPTLVERSRDAARNLPLATGAINTVCTNVIGTGLRMKAQIDRKRLNMTDNEADAWESLAESEFLLWSESTECDAARTLDFYCQQELAYRSSKEGGDVLTLTPMIERLPL